MSNQESGVMERIGLLIVSICVMTFVTVVVGYGGWLVLRISAAIGGPDPRNEDGERLRDRLLAWPQRNRDFIRSNGRGDLPLRP